MTDSSNPTQAAPEVTESAVRRRLGEVTTFVKGLAPESLTSGDWFAKLLHYSLDAYTREVDAAWFQKKYPALPRDLVAEQRIALAKKYAGIAGGLNASVYSGAVAATVGSGGGASPISMPAGAASFVVDVAFLSDLQLKLAYDLSVLYDHPVDTGDPEDLYDLLRVAFGVKASEVFRGGLTKLAPEAVRVGVKTVVKGTTLSAMRALPVVGKYLLQRNVIKFAIPFVNVPLSAGMNWYFMGRTGQTARAIFRLRAQNEAAANHVADSLEADSVGALLGLLTLVVLADGTVTRDEALFLQRVTEVLSERVSDEVMERYRRIIDVEENQVIAQLGRLPADERHLVLEAADSAAAADGSLHRKERALLARVRKAVR